MDKKVMQAAYAYEEERGRFIPCIDEKLESWHSQKGEFMGKKYETVIGLEVHVELSTKTKIFCSCPISFGEEPNSNICRLCDNFYQWNS